MKTTFFLSLSFMFSLLFYSCSSEAQSTKSAPVETIQQLEVIQFHSEHRCKTCNNIEDLAKSVVGKNSKLKFRLINVDDKKNANMAAQFEAAGTALFIYNPKTGKMKDLTDFAFMNAGSPDKFRSGLRKEIEKF